MGLQQELKNFWYIKHKEILIKNEIDTFAPISIQGPDQAGWPCLLLHYAIVIEDKEMVQYRTSDIHCFLGVKRFHKPIQEFSVGLLSSVPFNRSTAAVGGVKKKYQSNLQALHFFRE